MRAWDVAEGRRSPGMAQPRAHAPRFPDARTPGKGGSRESKALCAGIESSRPNQIAKWGACPVKKWFLSKVAVVFCALVRHSLLHDCTSILFVYCGRCGGQITPREMPRGVGIHCGCEDCRAAYAKTGWVDRFLVPRPEWVDVPLEVWIERKRAAHQAAMADVFSRVFGAPPEDRAADQKPWRN